MPPPQLWFLNPEKPLPNTIGCILVFRASWYSLVCLLSTLANPGTVIACGWNNAGQTNVPVITNGVCQIATGGNTVFAVTNQRHPYHLRRQHLRPAEASFDTFQGHPVRPRPLPRRRPKEVGVDNWALNGINGSDRIETPFLMAMTIFSEVRRGRHLFVDEEVR